MTTHPILDELQRLLDRIEGLEEATACQGGEIVTLQHQLRCCCNGLRSSPRPRPLPPEPTPCPSPGPPPTPVAHATQQPSVDAASWPSDSDSELRAEEERRALVAGYGLPRISRLREQWLAFRCCLPDSDEGESTRAFMRLLQDRVQPLSRSQRSEFLCGCRVLGFLLPARGYSGIGARCVIAPAYRRKR